MNIGEQVDKIDPTFWNRIQNYPMSDIDGEFMGFTDIYENLAKIIPKQRTVIDLGCAYAPQAVYFQDHQKYIGVDISDCPKVKTKNSEYYNISIRKFIEEELPKLKDENIFAICSYVPPWHDDNEKLVRENFKHLFVYYVSGDDLNEIRNQKAKVS